MENDNNYNGGISFCGLLCIVFIILKLLNVISWSWLWVLSPIWIPASIILTIFVIMFLIALFFYKRDAKKHLKQLNNTLCVTNDTISDMKMPFGNVRKGNFFKDGNFLYLKVGYADALRVEEGKFCSDVMQFNQHQLVTNKIGMNLSNFIEE